MDAEDIVRALAAESPNLEIGDMFHQCALCGESLPVKPADHDPKCPWRLAREWVEVKDGPSLPRGESQ